MKKSLFITVLCIAAGLGVARADEHTFTGEIMDSQCAMNGSHAPMLKKEGMGDKDPNDPMVKEMCTKNCIKMGGKYVLYDSAAKKIYQLDDQTKPEQFAGKNVKVTGTLSNDTIHVANIEPGL